MQKLEKPLLHADVHEWHLTVPECLTHWPRDASQLVQFSLVGVEAREDHFTQKTGYVLDV